MIGQELLISKLNTYTLDTLPKSILLLGEVGSGRRSISKMLADKFNIELVNIDSKITFETLNSYQQCPVDKLYVIDISNFTGNSQNQFLKIIEEPAPSVHLILIATSPIEVIETILNRCIIFNMAEYTVDQLKQIKLFNNEIIYNICRTPGQLLMTDEKSFNFAYANCVSLVNEVINTSQLKILDFAEKINYTGEYDKIDFNLFFKLILYISKENYLKNNDSAALKIYLFTSKFIQSKSSKSPTYVKQYIMNYLIHLKQAVMN